MDARTMVRADAAFEAGLGIALLIGVAAGGFGADDFPSPVGSAVLAAVGVLLLLVACALWRGAMALTALALANLATAVAALVWLAADSGFSAAGAAVVAATAGILVCLSLAQAAALRTG